jgi:hypothetical protein
MPQGSARDCLCVLFEKEHVWAPNKKMFGLTGGELARLLSLPTCARASSALNVSP